MSGSIGSTPQIQTQTNNVIQNSVQQNAQQAVSRKQQQPNAQVAQSNTNQDFVKLAQDIITERAANPQSTPQAAAQRGQVLNLLV